jgi:ribosomally synthesized peptide (two-chain TOMM family)
MSTKIEITESWRSIWLKAVALSWEDEGFRAQLVANPREALWQRFGYQVPGEVDIKISQPDGSQFGWRPGEGPSNWTMPAANLDLQLPPAPKAKAEDWAIALADYADSTSYPFTSC